MYDFNLNLSSGKRWKEIIEANQVLIEEMKPHIEELIRPFEDFSGLISSSIEFFHAIGNIEYAGEIKTLARAFGIPFWKAVLMQLCFELNSWGSTVCEEIDSKPVMLRTMNSKLEFLKKATINLHVKNGNDTVYYATTWLGYVGILTATKPNMFSISANIRAPESIDVFKFVEKEGKSLIDRKQLGYVLRYACETYRDMNDLTRYLKNKKLIAKCYITLCRANQIPLTLIREEHSNNFYEAGFPHSNDNITHLNEREGKSSTVEDFIKSAEVTPNTIYRVYCSPKDGVHMLLV